MNILDIMNLWLRQWNHHFHLESPVDACEDDRIEKL